jgi:hypothetical protein
MGATGSARKAGSGKPAYNGTVAGLNSGTGDRALDRYIPDWLVHHHHA